MTTTEAPVDPLELAKSFVAVAESAAIHFFKSTPNRHLSTYHGRGECTEDERVAALKEAKLVQLWEDQSYDSNCVIAQFELETEARSHFWEYRARRTTLMNIILDYAKSAG